MARSVLYEIVSFSFAQTVGINPLAPYYNDVFNADVAEQLETIYKQLYPQRDISSILWFYTKLGCITIAGDLIGSDMPGPNSRTSSVIMAYWPSRGLNNIDFCTMQDVVVQYFIRHILSYHESYEKKRGRAHFWLLSMEGAEQHPHYNWFGVSATICVNSFESASPCCLLPVQRIICRCASIVMHVDFCDISKTVFIACGIVLRYSVVTFNFVAFT